MRRGLYPLIVTIIALILIAAIKHQSSIGDREFAGRVLDQYIRYFCPNAGVCSRKNALERLRRQWPHIYSLGFSILEDEK